MACIWYNHHHHHHHYRYHDHELSYWGELRWNRNWWLRSPRFCKRNWILWLIWQVALSGCWVQCRVGDHSSFVGGSEVLPFLTFFNERLDTQRHRYERLLGFRFCFYDILTDILFYFYRLVCFFVKYFLGPFCELWAQYSWDSALPKSLSFVLS